jgi:hypothetical protein
MAVIGSKMVLAETCSLVDGSKRMTSPLPLPSEFQISYRNRLGRYDPPNAILPLRIHAATLSGSYEAKREIWSPVNRSQTMAVWRASYVTTSRPAPVSLTLSTAIILIESVCLLNRLCTARESCCRQTTTGPCAYRNREEVEAQGSKGTGGEATFLLLEVDDTIGSRLRSEAERCRVSPEEAMEHDDSRSELVGTGLTYQPNLSSVLK